MPVVPKIQRTDAIEAKYNVTIEFPYLGLHSAAATGNLGLVKYALEHGQPINSVLDGVLPLHAACSGGNDLVVRLLIERGADVNAPRLPRKYSSDKGRAASAPIVGASGSTPLHFACANGHTPVVLTLLLHGAHPDRPDKHGKTPEMLARQNGWLACADVLQQWYINKDKDLREKEEVDYFHADITPNGTLSREERHLPCSSSDCRICTSGKRIRVKRSLDHALQMLKPSLSYPHPSSAQSDMAISSLEPIIASPLLPSESPEDTLLRTITDSPATEPGGRRPSLPDVFDAHSAVPITRRSRGPSSRRPRSAGTDADSSPATHRLKGKVSLLSIFKKSIGDSYGMSESSSGYASSNSPSASGSTSPAPRHRATSPAPLLTNEPSEHPPMPRIDRSPTDPTASRRFRGRLFSEGESRATSHRPLAVELHRALSEERLRSRSNPGQHLALPPDSRPESSSTHRSPSVRPSILRPHNRSISSGQSQTESPRSDLPSPRALRFDPSTSPTIRPSSFRRQTSNSPARSIRVAKSISSIRSGTVSDNPRSPLVVTLDGANHEVPLTDEPEDGHAVDADEEEEQYGEPIAPRVGVVELGTRLSALKMEERTRTHSTQSSQGSLSPLPSPGVVIETAGFDCPFSINEPPPDESESPTHPNFLGIHGIENRLRGDSMSSMSTTGTSGYVSTPGVTQSQLPPPHIAPAVSTPPEYPSIEQGGRGGIQRGPSTSGSFANDDEGTVTAKVPPAALDIDIRSISSHAQAEALVQRAQQSILEMQDAEANVVSMHDGTIGRTPLSAKLAAYGESLAIERKFKQEEEERRHGHSFTQSMSLAATGRGSLDQAKGRSISMRHLDRKYSLEERTHHNTTIRQSRVRRPHTSGGDSTSDMFPSPRRDGSASSINLHQPSASRSQFITTSISPPTADLKGDTAASLTPPKSSHLKVRSEAYVDKGARVRRSRTPDPESDVMSSSPSFGMPLSRISTAPAQDSCRRPTRELSSQERQAARANKLVKMGFSSPDSWQNTMPNARGQPSQAGGKQRFGGIKGFVQSLQLMGK